ncbi:hypothetical protein Tco_0255957 [Tanacetum coccineum]
MTKLAFCDYHNMVAILEKTELNTDFHQIVDFLEASHIRYALTVRPTVYISHVQQFWSTARVEIVDGETKIIAKVNGRQRTVTESFINRHLKLLNDEGISTLPDNELFENLSLMGYNISPNQRFSFQKGQFSHQWKFLIHTIMQCLSPKSTGFNEFSSNIATAIVCLATNRVYNFSKMIFDGMVRNIKSKVKFLMYPRFIEKCLKMGQFGVIKHTETYTVPFHTQKVFTTLRVNSPSFSGRTVQLFESMLVPHGEGSDNPTEPHHTPSTQYESSPHEEQTTSQEPIPQETTNQTTSQESIPQTTTLPSKSHSYISTPRRLTRGVIQISQSKAPSPGADETASPTRDDRHGEAFPTATSLDARQDRENIAKTSAMPHEASPGVTSLGGGEGRMQQKLQKLMNMCTNLQQQHLLMEQRIQSQDLEITQLKNIVKTLEDTENKSKGFAQEDAPNTWGMDQGEDLMAGDVKKSTEKGSDNTDEAVNVLSSLEAANVLSSGSFPTAAPAGVATVSGSFPIAVIFTTASVTTPYTRRTRASRGIIIEPSHTTNVPTISTKGKGKEKMVESTSTKKKKIQEQLDAQVARELEEEFAREEQVLREQGEKDAEVARAQAERELKMMIVELDRSNELIAKYINEYEQAKADLTLEEKMELITELIKYQRNLAEIKRYQAQQSKPATKTEKRNFYMEILKSHAGWKSKDFRGMTFEQIEEKFIPVWKQMQDFVPMNSKIESERVKRPGIQLAQESSKRLKTAKASGSEPSQEQQTKDPKELSQEELKKMMEKVPVKEVYIEALQAKYPIIEWEIYNEEQRKYWKVIRVGNHTEVYQTFEEMLKKFDREDLDRLWSLVKETFSTADPTEDKEKEL